MRKFWKNAGLIGGYSVIAKLLENLAIFVSNKVLFSWLRVSQYLIYLEYKKFKALIKKLEFPDNDLNKNFLFVEYPKNFGSLNLN